MHSRIITQIRLDDWISPGEVQHILGLRYNREYSEFVFGEWTNCVLWNGTGSHHDSQIHEYSGAARPTELARDLRGVNAILSTCFDDSRLKWLRVFVQTGGVLLPHIDYSGMRRGFTRVHLPLQTSRDCLHSEEDVVYHMRRGELWFIDASRLHSACNLSNRPRVSLCFDFDPGVPLDELIRAPFRIAESPAMDLIELEPMTESDQAYIRRLVAGMTEHNLDDVVGELAMMHFRRKSDAGAVFQWISAFRPHAGGAALLERVAALRTLAMGVESPCDGGGAE